MTHHPSFGTGLKWDPAGGTSYAAIGQVKDISGPSISRGEIDVSDQDSKSAADGYREYLPGLADGGELTFTIGFDTTNNAHKQGVGTGLIGDFEQGGCTLAAWELTMNTCSGTAVWTFDGFVTGFTPDFPVEGENTAEVTVKISGKPTLTVT